MSESSAKPGRLLGRWSKRENDFLFSYPSKPDGHYLYGVFSFIKDANGRTLVEELERRGYDVKTLRFQVDLLTPPTPQKEQK
jgi:hypothetical protein